MKSLKKALAVFLDEAYKGTEIPEPVRALSDKISGLNNFSELLAIPDLESPADGVVAIRLGNHLYPHMKLVVRKEGGQLCFAVDTHDGPDRIPPSLPGYERFREVIRENARIRDAIHSRLAGHMKQPGADNTQPSRGRILVVDDESFVRDILSRLLHSFGFDTVTADSADQALEQVRKNRFSCCFLDIMMPGKSGYQFIEGLEAEGLKTFPIVLVTGMNPKHIRMDVAEGLILKPFTASMLKEHLSAFGLF
ncbi:MAG: response regulator [Acidobacteria bacterium]|nr:response regulator [Acidobacteriota bacterium]